MYFGIDSWQVARILNLKKDMASNEKVIISNGIYMVVKKSGLEMFVERLFRTLKKGDK